MILSQRFLVAAVSMLSLVTLIGAEGCRQGGSDRQLPSDLKIVFGRQGTVAGRGVGYSIDGRGTVVRWEGKYPEEIKQATATVEEEEVRRLWKRAQEIGFLDMQDQAMATVYTFITLTADGESRRVTWTERDEASLTPAQTFFDECREVAKTALGEPREGD